MVSTPAISEEVLPLTGLRFVAALYVFLFHIHLRWPLAEDATFLGNVLGQGAVGMSLFFVLSGFILAKRYGDGRGSYSAYLTNRFSRIYPVYALVALLTLPWLGISFESESVYGVVRQVVAAAVLIFSDVFLIQAWFPQFFSYWNNGGSWSISVEAFCYVLLPILLTGLAKRSTTTITKVALGAYVLAVLPGLSFVLFGGNQTVFYSMPIFRLPEFILGICTCIAAQRVGSWPRSTAALQLIAMGILVTYLGVIGPKLPAWVTHNWIVLPVISLTIFSLSRSYGVISLFLSTRLMVWAGHISYSFYSFQLLVLLILKSYHSKIVATIPALADNRLLLLASFAALIALSAMGYHLVEEPCRKWIKARSTRPKEMQSAPMDKAA